MHLLYTFLLWRHQTLRQSPQQQTFLCQTDCADGINAALIGLFPPPFTLSYWLIELLQRKSMWIWKFFFFVFVAKWLYYALKVSRWRRRTGVLKCQRLLMKENRISATRAITADRPRSTHAARPRSSQSCTSGPFSRPGVSDRISASFAETGDSALWHNAPKWKGIYGRLLGWKKV